MRVPSGRCVPFCGRKLWRWSRGSSRLSFHWTCSGILTDILLACFRLNKHKNSNLSDIGDSLCTSRTNVIENNWLQEVVLTTLSLLMPLTTSAMRFSNSDSVCTATPGRRLGTPPGNGGKLVVARSNLGGGAFTSDSGFGLCEK